VGGVALLLSNLRHWLSLPMELRGSALILMPILSRWGMVYAISAFPPAKEEGMGWAVKQGVSWRELSIATVFSLLAALSLLKWWGAILMAALCLILFLFSKYLYSRFAGLTGDNYGAISEFAEVVVLILMFVLGEHRQGKKTTNNID